MANPITRKELAKLIGQTPGYVGMYVHRRKIIEENHRIDTDHPINKAWIARNTIKSLNETIEKEKKPAPKERYKKKPFIPKIEETLLNDISVERMPANTIDAVKKKREIAKLDADIKLKELEYKKKKARVLPLDFVIEWGGRNLRGVFGETVNFGDSIIEQICNELGADIEIKLKYKKQFRQGFHEVLKIGIKNQEPEALEQAKEYSLSTKW